MKQLGLLINSVLSNPATPAKKIVVGRPVQGTLSVCPFVALVLLRPQPIDRLFSISQLLLQVFDLIVHCVNFSFNPVPNENISGT